MLIPSEHRNEERVLRSDDFAEDLLFAFRRLSYTCRNLAFVEHRFMCPYCGEEISMILDLSIPRQVYIEDCEVCCNPIEISYTAEDDLLTSFNARRLE